MWQPIGPLPWFIGFAEDGVALADGHLAALRTGIEDPYRLDEASRARSKSVFGQTRADLVELFEPQGQRWAALDLDPAVREEVKRYQGLVAENLRLVEQILAVCDELEPFTIEALLRRSDLEVGIEAAVRDLTGH